MSEKQKPIILVDGSSYLFRAYHALPPLVNSKNFPTGAIYGVINMLKRLLKDFDPEYMGVVFDAPGKTFRDDIYADYKANRSETPEDLIQQIQPLYNIIKAMGLPLIVVEGVEADDVIGTLAHEAAKQKKEVVISTSDKDLAQLVNDHVTLINTMSNTLLDPTGVEQKFGVPPERIIDYLTLVGDTSDNIPGVPKVGPKTAAKWLKQYGSLDSIVTNADKITGKVGDNLRGFIGDIPMTKSLVTIKLDLSLEVNVNDLKINGADAAALAELYKEYEFKTWLSEALHGNSKQQKETSTIKYDIVQDNKTFTKWMKMLEKAKLIAFDTETTSLDYMEAKLVGISVSTSAEKAAYIPFGHDYEDAPTQLNQEDVLAAIKPILENPDIKKVGQNIKYDIEVCANYDIAVNGVAFDTMLESYILDSSGNGHDMDSLALKYLGVRTITYKDVAGSGSKQLTFNQVTLEKAGPYAAEDADITLRLHDVLWPKLQKQKGLTHIFEAIEMPLISVLARMERHGVLIEPNKLKKQGEELQKRLDELAENAYAIADSEFNINSPKQLQEILFTKLKLPILQKTPTGQPSTADAVLQELAHDYELPHIIIEYRSLSKLISTYTSRLIEKVHASTGRVHTSYNQTGAATGRLSSSDPNLQNIPIRTSEGRKIRQAFIAPPNHKLISADYSQIELRLMAHISEDKTLLNAFANNLDIHKATAAEVWGVPLEEVSNDMRRGAKAINFGLLYGMSAFGLTRQLGVDRKEAQAYIDRYFERYPGVRQYMDATREKAREQGYVETLWGRRLYLPDINASKIPRQRAAERTAINAPLQGSAADIIKMAMIKIDQQIQHKQIEASMVMQVHDELVFEVPDHAIEKVSAQVQETMSTIVDLKVPLLVSVGVGDNWDKASEH